MVVFDRDAGDAIQHSLILDTPWSLNGDLDEVAIERYGFDRSEGVLVRQVRADSGDEVESLVVSDGVDPEEESDYRSAYERAWLRLQTAPTRMELRREVRVVDLFSGCGGMTLGVAEACRALGYKALPVLAIDIDGAALEVFKTNFPDTDAWNERIEEILDGDLGADLTENERKLRDKVGEVDVLVAGPPCQGSSDLNNHTRREDPKNALYAKVARAAEVLQPEHLIIENVLGIRHDANKVFQRTRNHLENETDEVDYSVDSGILRAEDIGVPQTRHRVFLVASTEKKVSLERFVAPFRTEVRTFSWACGDLVDRVEEGLGFDAPSNSAPVTKRRIDYLFDEDLHELPDELRPPCHRDKDHNYPSVYGRMWDDKPAPTITTGFTAMGQGRFVHPTRRRTITPHEAARLQGFPDYFEFGERTRAEYKRLIGNAVPPKLSYALALQLLR